MCQYIISTIFFLIMELIILVKKSYLYIELISCTVVNDEWSAWRDMWIYESTSVWWILHFPQYLIFIPMNWLFWLLYMQFGNNFPKLMILDDGNRSKIELIKYWIPPYCVKGYHRRNYICTLKTMGLHFGNLVVTAGTAGFRHDNLLSYDTVDIMMTPGFQYIYCY